MLDDDDERIRYAAVNSLERIGNTDDLPTLRSNAEKEFEPWMKAYIEKVIRRISSRSHETLLR